MQYLKSKIKHAKQFADQIQWNQPQKHLFGTLSNHCSKAGK